MFRYLLSLAFLILCLPISDASSGNLRWSDLIESHNYKVDRKLEFFYNNQTFTINEDGELKLHRFKAMPMIDIYLAQFQILKCTEINFTSEMILESIDQADGAKAISVSANVAPDCLLEVFLERNDFNRFSFLNSF